MSSYTLHKEEEKIFKDLKKLDLLARKAHTEVKGIENHKKELVYCLKELHFHEENTFTEETYIHHLINKAHHDILESIRDSDLFDTDERFILHAVARLRSAAQKIEHDSVTDTVLHQIESDAKALKQIINKERSSTVTLEQLNNKLRTIIKEIEKQE